MSIVPTPRNLPRAARKLISADGFARHLMAPGALSTSLRHRRRTAISRRGLAAVGFAAAAALSAALIAWRSREAERQNPPRGGFIDIDGVRLHYLDRGAGPPLVLLHGNGSMIEELEASGLLDLAARKYRVIAFDRPGFGYSERPRTRLWGPQAQAQLLWRALARLGIENPIVVGHSWGTFVALRLALEHPDAVRGLVLASGYYFPSLRFDVALLSGPAIPVLGDLMRWTLSPWIGRLAWPLILRRIFGPAPVPPAFAEIPVWMMLRPRQLRAAAAESAMMIPATMALGSRYRELTMPVVVLAGEADRHVRVDQSQRLANELAHGELRTTPGAGHMLHHFAPERVVAAVDAVASVSGRAGADRSSAEESSHPVTSPALTSVETGSSHPF